MKNTIFALLFAGSLASGCASGAGLTQRGAVVVGADSVRAFAAGPAVVHAFSMDHGGGVYIVPASTGTDADCVQGRATNHDRTTPLQVDHRNVVDVGPGQVACVATGDRRLELLWHAEPGTAPASSYLVAQAHR